MFDVSEEPALRADALRNRQRILEAAADCFAESGLEVGVAEIARRAGVGAGTLFRRFPTKDDLVQAIVEMRMDELIAVADSALEDPDAGAALRRFMAAAAESQARDRGFFESAAGIIHSDERLMDLKGRILGAAGALLDRAKAAGAVRDDLTAGDVMLLTCAAAGACGTMDPVAPGLWRRYLGVILDGMSPDAASPLEPEPPDLGELERAFDAVNPQAARQRTG